MEQPVALTSLLLEQAGFRHAFFTRQGGVSRPPWDSLSFAASVGDEPDAVRENFARAARRLGIPSERLYVLQQVHGTAFRVLMGAEDPGEVMHTAADITLARSAGVGCAVRTADCVPVLIADRRTGAVAAIHSGWRGAAANVTAAGIAALRLLTQDKGDLVAAIGPHIAWCCFEVGEDVATQLAGCSTAGDAAVRRGEGKPHVNLRRVVRAQLEAEGVMAIDDVFGCTKCDRTRFHSFRRDGKRSGSMLSAIVAR